MTLRNQQIVNDCSGKADPTVVQALCLLNDEIVGLKHENKELAGHMLQMVSTLNDLSDGMKGIGDVVKTLDDIRGETE